MHIPALSLKTPPNFLNHYKLLPELSITTSDFLPTNASRLFSLSPINCYTSLKISFCTDGFFFPLVKVLTICPHFKAQAICWGPIKSVQPSIRILSGPIAFSILPLCSGFAKKKGLPTSSNMPARAMLVCIHLRLLLFC
jgi:hypothetical protein